MEQHCDMDWWCDPPTWTVQKADCVADLRRDACKLGKSSNPINPVILMTSGFAKSPSSFVISAAARELAVKLKNSTASFAP